VLGDMPSSKVIGMISDASNLRVGMASTLVAFAVGAVIFFVGGRFAPTLADDVEAPAPA
jgi:MFS transporter, Spinster family, sphingosine-1-phosphate transporter